MGRLSYKSDNARIKEGMEPGFEQEQWAESAGSAGTMIPHVRKWITLPELDQIFSPPLLIEMKSIKDYCGYYWCPGEFEKIIPEFLHAIDHGIGRESWILSWLACRLAGWGWLCRVYDFSPAGQFFLHLHPEGKFSLNVSYHQVKSMTSDLLPFKLGKEELRNQVRLFKFNFDVYLMYRSTYLGTLPLALALQHSSLFSNDLTTTLISVHHAKIPAWQFRAPPLPFIRCWLLVAVSYSSAAVDMVSS